MSKEGFFGPNFDYKTTSIIENFSVRACVYMCACASHLCRIRRQEHDTFIVIVGVAVVVI